MSMLRYHTTAQMQMDFLNAKVAEAQKTLKDALMTADTVSKDQGQKIKALEETVEKLKKSADVWKKSAEELKSSKAEVDKALLEEKKTNIEVREKSASLERQVELFQAKVVMLEENLATERETLALKVADAEDKFTELAWYRMWVNNPDVNFSFLEGDLEKTLALWRARLKEEEEENRSLSMAINKDDYIKDASSKAEPKSVMFLDAEIDALLGDDDLGEEQRVANAEAARQENIQIVRETLAEVDPSNQNLLPQP